MKKLLLLFLLSFLCNFAIAQIGFNGGSSGANRIGTLDSVTSAKGLTIVGKSIFTQSATSSLPGLINNSTQSLSGNKTLYGTIIPTATQASVFTGMQIKNTYGRGSNYNTTGASLKLTTGNFNATLGVQNFSNNDARKNSLIIASDSGIQFYSNAQNGYTTAPTNFRWVASSGNTVAALNENNNNPVSEFYVSNNNGGSAKTYYSHKSGATNTLAYWYSDTASSTLGYGSNDIIKINKNKCVGINTTNRPTHTLEINGVDPLKLGGVQVDPSPVKILTLSADSIVRRISLDDIDLNVVTQFNNTCDHEIFFNGNTHYINDNDLILDGYNGSGITFDWNNGDIDYNTYLYQSNPTHTNVLILPDTSGTIVMSVNEVLADSKGNVNLNAFPVKLISNANYDATVNDANIFYNGSLTANRLVMLTTLSTTAIAGQTLTIKTPPTITIYHLTIHTDPNTIDGSNDFTLTHMNQSVTLVFDGTNWRVTSVYN